MSGRPLRFLAVTMAGWTALRVAMLWPAGNAGLPQPLVAAAQAETPARQIIEPRPLIVMPRAAQSDFPYSIPWRGHLRIATVSVRPIPLVAEASPIAGRGSSIWTMPSLHDAQPIAPFAAPLPGRPPAPSRWSGSAWLVLRGGDGVAPGSSGDGQLGGSQGGARLAYAIDPTHHIAIVGRVTSPRRGPGREASIGFEWRPTRLPVRLVVERRFAIDGGVGGPAAGVIAGTGPAPLALGFDLESYGEAGAIRRDRTEPFADGAARLTRPIRLGGVKLDIGAGAWGGAQRAARRLDVGPTIGARLPVAGQAIRATLDWRQRVAGGARPGSGPALTIGADF